MDVLHASALTACAVEAACSVEKAQQPGQKSNTGNTFLLWSIKNLTRFSQPAPLGALANMCIWETTIPGRASLLNSHHLLRDDIHHPDLRSFVGVVYAIIAILVPGKSEAGATE